MILFIITLNHCYATDKTKYIDEYSARQRLYLITILKCNISGGTSKNNVDVFAFVEKNFSKTYTLTEGERKKILVKEISLLLILKIVISRILIS